MTFNAKLATGTVLLLSAFSAQATDLVSNFSFHNGVKVYGGASAGYSVQGNICTTQFFTGTCDEGNSGYKVFTGIRLNPMLGAEIAYVDHGSAQLDGSVGVQQVAGNNKITGYQVTGVGYLPLSPEVIPNLEIMGKVGASFWQRETQTRMGATNTETKDDGISPMLGMGAQYQFHPNMYLRGEWEHTFGTGADSQFETDTDNYSMSLMYSTL